MKSLGVDWIISVSATGSLKEEIDMGHMVIVDQFIDRTKYRRATFFGDGVIGHAPFGDPCCNTLRKMLIESAEEVGIEGLHKSGTYVNMEGPAFSTKAESNLHRSYGASVIGIIDNPYHPS